MPSNGINAIMGMAATSWNSRMANAASVRGAELVALGQGRQPIAVDESAKPSPAISAVFQSNPATIGRAAVNTADSTTCSEPAPNTDLRISHKRFGLSSVPMMNSSRITPNSENSDHCLVSGVS